MYHLNFGLIWRYFDRLDWGLLLSLELAAISIAVGIVCGLSLALLFEWGGRITRVIVASYVEFIRNVPLILLVYLVFLMAGVIQGENGHVQVEALKAKLAKARQASGASTRSRVSRVSPPLPIFLTRRPGADGRQGTTA